MNNFKKRISKVKNIIKPYIDALGFENDRQMRNDIKATANNELNVSVFRVCRNQADRNDITQEMKKYLIGKMYRAIINMDKNLISNYKLFLHYNGHSSYRNGLEIADALGKEFNISGASVVKYDLYARSIDDINIKQSVSAADILSGVDKISIENTIKLSKMTDDDINYLKMLFGKQFYKLTGYMCIKGSAAQDTF
ncbi:MAG: hypothetical protein LIO65_01935 [Odoribacter sp.]|nr:hypothetical protein [Odoribacter sp.]